MILDRSGVSGVLLKRILDTNSRQYSLIFAMELQTLPNHSSIHATARSLTKSGSDVVENVEIPSDSNIREVVSSQAANLPQSRTQLLKARIQFASLCFSLVLVGEFT